MDKVTGYVTGVNGNLVAATFSGSVRKNEVGYVQVGDDRLKGEVIRVNGDTASMQIYEMTNGIQVGDRVELSGELMSVELGPGLLTQVFDGLQNPLPELAQQCGFFLQRGVYLDPIPNKDWEFTPLVKPGDHVTAGDAVGSVPEGLFTHLIILVICSLMVPFPHEFLLLQVIAGMVVTFSLRDLYERSQLIRCAFFIFMSYALCYISLSIYQEADFKKINWMMMLYFGINFILLMFTYILVYMLEKTFGYVSSITLVELSNINTPILKKLSEISPGTFQHSLQMSILASEAAAAIGANAQLVRTGAMYHDIGKMANPAFFTENQSSINPHSQLSFDQSAKIIINHVNDGVKIAEKAMLPKAIIDFIRTHHGRGKAKYFYNSFKNQYPDREIDEEAFTYPGPNPFSKETAVLMMADSVEAASRSLKEHTEENIRALVDKIIDGQIADGLMRNAPLTFKDVETVKNVFVEKLKIMYNTRISYPDLKK